VESPIKHVQVEATLANTRFLAVANPMALRQEAVSRIADAAARSIAERGNFQIVLAGGNTPRAIYQDLRKIQTDWSRWIVYFGDERCLPSTHADRNSAMASHALLTHVAILSSNIYVIAGELGAAEAALNYAQTLDAIAAFDLVLLGLGEDGHTASLFPENDIGADAAAPACLAVYSAPKAPAERVSMSARRLSLARSVLFLVDGLAKRNAVARWRAGAQIPAAAISPPAGVDVLITDELLQADTLLAEI